MGDVEMKPGGVPAPRKARPSPRNMRRLRIAFVVMGAMFVIGTIVKLRKPEEKSADDATPAATDRATSQPPDAAAAAPVAGQPVVIVTALDLVKDYKANDVSADDKYRNRTLLITGILGKVGVDLLDMSDPSRVIFTTTAGEVSAIVGAAATKTLKRGQKVALRCIGKGFEMNTALLEDCAIE